MALSHVLNPDVTDTNRRGLMAVGVYLDESEDNQPGVFTLAGWLASQSTGWKDVIPAWQGMVADAPHEISEFHMTDIAQKSGDFSDDHGWTQDERDALVIRAADILCNPTISGGLTAFGVSIIRPEVPFPQDTPSYEFYKLAYEVLMLLILENRSAFRAFEFVFDCKEKVRGHVEANFSAAKAMIDAIPEYHGMLESVEFKSSKDLMPLQAADFIAYERRKRNSDRASGSSRHRRSFQRLCEREHHFKVFDKRFTATLLAKTRELGAWPKRLYDLIPDDED